MALHDIIQVAFRWNDAHLFEFEIGDKVYGERLPDDEFLERRVYQARSLRLGTLIDRGVARFLYVYDFGDDWRHEVIIEKVFDGEPGIDYPAFVDGARRTPPEDVGGAPGFMDFLEATLLPTHPEHERMREWYGGAFDPRDIEEKWIRGILSVLAARRRGPLASHRSGRRGR